MAEPTQPMPGVPRRLAVILADVAGYSRLMSEDEEGTLKTLSLYQEVAAALIALKETGNSFEELFARFGQPNRERILKELHAAGWRG